MINVTKRSGEKEELDLDKIHRELEWAADGLDCSMSEIEMRANLQFYDGVKTEDIQDILIKTAADLISDKKPDYQYLAARLSIFDLRKRVYGEFKPPHLMDILRKNTNLGYDPIILDSYTAEEIDLLDKHINHQRDMSFSYAAVKQFEGKYLMQDRVTKTIYETPQVLYMVLSMALFASDQGDSKINMVKDFYDAVSKFKISLPTPIMGGLRTATRQFSSCTLIETDDSLDSINASASSIVKYASQRAGIGLNAGRIRALNSPIRKGQAVHTGNIPFYKYFQSALKSCSQGALRGAAATVFYPIWHLEVESLLVLKNNKGVDENRVRHMDYGVQINRLMYQRLISGGNITLFSPEEVDGLYEAFFSDQDLFEKIYVEAENNPKYRKKVIPASQLFTLLAQERAGTGRIYIQNVDHCNTYGAFDEKKAPVRQSNLCMEINLPTKPLKHIFDPDGEIALCILAAVNMGEVESMEDLEKSCDLLVRALDKLIDYQEYPILAAKKSTLKRRPLGIGVINYAYYLAKNGADYSSGSGMKITHEFFEAFQYYLLKSSNALAKEKGACPCFGDTKYSENILPIDNYKSNIDDLGKFPYKMDWEALRKEIKTYGLRNSTLSALMPSETSSQISNATNGIEPPRGYMSIKASKDGVLRQVVPEVDKYKLWYETLWQMPDNKGYLQLVGIMQKFIDQSISANTNYDPSKFSGGRVPVMQILKDILYAYSLGVKSLYYHNTRDGSGDDQYIEDDGCDSGACKI